MASLKEIKARIASVQSTQKITSAMRMVASAKLHRTQNVSQDFLLYADSLRDIVSSLGQSAHSVSDDDVWNGEDVQDHGASSGNAKGTILIPISSSSGLCGAFNSNIAKALRRRIDHYKQQNIPLHIMPIGKKVAHELQKMEVAYSADFMDYVEKLGKDSSISYAHNIMDYVCSRYDRGEIDTVEILYHHFKSMGTQVITSHIVPVQRPQLAETTSADMQYITEPSASQLYADVYPRMLTADIHAVLLDAITSEHAARMLAMQTADDNAKELLQELTLLYNKTRQQAITNELIDIMGGKTVG